MRKAVWMIKYIQDEPEPFLVEGEVYRGGYGSSDAFTICNDDGCTKNITMDKSWSNAWSTKEQALAHQRAYLETSVEKAKDSLAKFEKKWGNRA